MRKIIIILTGILFYSLSLSSQTNIENIFVEIENNNTSLKVLRSQIDADKIANRDNLYPDNPEIGFNYLWGSPAEVNDRLDFQITQSFDFPTSYKIKRDLSNLKNEQIEYEFVRQKNELIYEARKSLSELNYLNNVEKIIEKRIAHFTLIEDAYQNKLDKGEATIFDLNKVHIKLVQLRNELESNRNKRISETDKLNQLNGGIDLNLTEITLVLPNISDDFETWFNESATHNPVLNWIGKEIGIKNSEESLARSMKLPSFNAGYLSEKVTGEYLQGFTIGLSLPIWQNNLKLDQARAQKLAVEKLAADQKLNFYLHLKSIHANITRQEKQLAVFREQTKKLEKRGILFTAMELGQINLIEYLMELTIYFDSADIILQLEKDIQLSKTELLKFGS
jgi:cobalt-zinc-cadmium efflux system outer membrane protein